ncbi:MAG: enoyl-ACP reductase FabI [Candidatus Dormibacteria bacterium]
MTHAGVPGMLTGKRIIVTGVLTPKSIAYCVAEQALREGAELILTSFGRAMSLTERSAKRLSASVSVFELDVTKSEDFATLGKEVAEKWDRVDGIVHAIGFAPNDALGKEFLATSWTSVATAFHISAYSLAPLVHTFEPLMTQGGSVVSLTFDASVAWPIYDWMGPAKAALESISRYVARDLGHKNIRCNTIAAGPLDTVAAKSIPAFNSIKEIWNSQSPLKWDTSDASPVADATIFLLSDRARSITGEVLHVDGGYHAMGAPIHGAES